MRSLLTALPIVSLLVSCARPEPMRMPETASAPGPQRVPETAAASQGGLPPGYSLTDTTQWGNVLGEEGQRAILRREGVVIDTVDIDFGILFGGKDSLVFLPVRTDTVPLVLDSIVEYQSGQTEHVLWTPTSRRELRDILPFFDSFFSSPTIADKPAIYYWGVAPDSGKVTLYAIRHNFRTARLDSVFLSRQDGIGGTDARDYYGIPQIRGTEVSFGAAVVDKTTWRVIREDP